MEAGPLGVGAEGTGEARAGVAGGMEGGPPRAVGEPDASTVSCMLFFSFLSLVLYFFFF